MIQSAINRTLSLAGVLINMKPRTPKIEEKPTPEEKKPETPKEEGNTTPSSPMKQAETMAGKSNESLLAERERFLKSRDLLKNLTSEEE